MNIPKIQNEIREAITLLGEDSALHSRLTRSVFDIGLNAVIGALIHRDDVLPVLTANALRPVLKSVSSTDEGWQACLDFVKEVSPQIAADPVAYASDQTNMTRNSFRKDTERQAASAMLFHGTGPSYYTLRNSAGYGLIWANERARYQELDLKNKIIGTFACRNTFNIEMNGDYPHEIVHPALVFNSSIDAVLINYDIEQNPSNPYEHLSRSFLIRPSNESDGKLLICEGRQTSNELHRPSDVPEGIGEYEEVSEIHLQDNGSVTVEGSENYDRVIRDLLAA